MIATQAVTKILGIRRPTASTNDLRKILESGLPKAALSHVVNYIVLDPIEAQELKNRLVPPATFKRRTTTLKLEEGERIERLARVMAIAEDAFGSTEDAREFLLSEHPELGDERPLDVAQSELGARQVEEILWRMEYGLPM